MADHTSSASAKPIKPIVVSDEDLGIAAPAAACTASITTASFATAPEPEPKPGSAEDFAQQRRSASGQVLPKDQKASDIPISCGMLLSATEHSITLQAIGSWAIGLLFLYALVFLAPGFGGVYFGLELFSWIDLSKMGLFLSICGVFLGSISFATGIAALLLSLKCFRFTFGRPVVQPIVFNRKTRQVHIWHQDAGAGIFSNLLRPFKPWPMVLETYPWNCIEAEGIASLQAGGNTVRAGYDLVLWVKDSPSSAPHELQGMFKLGQGHNEHTARGLWEYVRRYMDSNGPPLSPGDVPATLPSAKEAATASMIYAAMLSIVLFGWMWISHGKVSLDLWWQFSRNPLDGGAVFAVLNFLYAMCIPALIGHYLGHLLAPHPKPPEALYKDAGQPIDLQKLVKPAA